MKSALADPLRKLAFVLLLVQEDTKQLSTAMLGSFPKKKSTGISSCGDHWFK
jgi:hypothetical protein